MRQERSGTSSNELSQAGRHGVIAVFAHPDDEALACGGTLAKLADSGVPVSLACASHGERGGAARTDVDADLARVRSLELRKAAAVLGISDVVLFDYPDGELRWALVSEFRAELAMLLERRRPAAVITFGGDGLYWHGDHVGVHEQTTAVVRSLGVAAPRLYYVTMPPDTMSGIIVAAQHKGWTAPAEGFWSLPPDAFGYAAREPTIVMDVADWVPRKLAALQCHRSQLGERHPFSELDTQEAIKWLGVEHFHAADLACSGPPLLEPLACTSRR